MSLHVLCDTHPWMPMHMCSDVETHSDYRPYKCGRCNQEFKWESSFKAHIASKSHKENGSSRGGGSGGSSTLGFAPGRGGSSRGDSSRGSGSSPPGPLPPFHTLSGSGRGWPSGSGALSGGRGPLPPVSSLLPENPSGSSPMRRSSGTR